MTPEIREALLQALPYTSPAMAEKITGMLLENRLFRLRWVDHLNHDVDPYCVAFVNATITREHELVIMYLKSLRLSILSKKIKQNA